MNRKSTRGICIVLIAALLLTLISACIPVFASADGETYTIVYSDGDDATTDPSETVSVGDDHALMLFADTGIAASGTFAYWTTEDGRFFTDGITVRNLASAGETVTLTAVQSNLAAGTAVVCFLKDNRIFSPDMSRITVEGGTLSAGGVEITDIVDYADVTYDDPDAGSKTFEVDEGGVLVIDLFTVSVSGDGNGTVSAAKTCAFNGDDVSLTATANDGYQFEKWTVSDSSVTPSYTPATANQSITVNGPTALSASFTAVTTVSAVDVTGLDAPAGGSALDTEAVSATTGVDSVSVAWSPADTTAAFNSTYTATVTVTPASGYVFDSATTATLNGETVTPTLSEGKLVITKDYTTAKAKLNSITDPADMTAANGTALDALTLPSTVTVSTEDSTVTSADVTWDKTNIYSGTYDPTLPTAQTFTLKGTVTLPETIDANGIDLAAYQKVTVEAGTVTLTNADLTVPAPAAGESLDRSSTTCSTTGMTVDTTLWTPLATTAGYNTAYTVNVTLTAADGYQFADTMTATVNGQTATATVTTASNTGITILTVSYTFPATEKADLVSITDPDDITGVANGKALSDITLPTTVAITTEDTSSSTSTTADVTWDLSTATPAYDPTVTDAAQTFTVTGTVTLPDDVKNDNNVALTATQKITVDEKRDPIAAIALTVEEPYGGEELQDAVSDTTGVTASSTSWGTLKDTAEFETVYTVTITVSTEDGYELASSPTATVNGNTATVSTSSSGVTTVSYTFPATGKAKLLSVTQPTQVNKDHGTAPDTSTDLPSTVTIETEDEDVTSADVTWDTASATPAYDSTTLDEQKITYTGTITVPDGIDPNGVSTTVTQEIVIAAAPSCDQVKATPEYGTTVTYTADTEVTLTTATSGASIYYTTDGSVPTTASTLYTGPFTLTGEQGRVKTYTVNAIAVKDGMNNSVMQSAKYVIAIPAAAVDIQIDAPVGGEALDFYPAFDSGTVSRASTTTWSPAGVNADYQTVYTATTTITPQNAKLFGDSTVFTVNGQTPTSISKNDAGQVTLSYTFPETAKAKINSISAPTAVAAEHGTPIDEIALPSTVKIDCEDTTYRTLPVTWDLTNFASGTYDPNSNAMQVFVLKGTVTVPDELDASGVSTTVTVTVTVKAGDTYTITSGGRSSWVKGTSTGLTITGSGPYSKFISVKVDGLAIASTYYTVAEGSTIITLTPTYLNTLATGRHTFEIVWSDGSADTTFTIRASGSGSGAKTGDSGHAALWIAVIVIAAVLVAVVIVVLVRKNSKGGSRAKSDAKHTGKHVK